MDVEPSIYESKGGQNLELTSTQEIIMQLKHVKTEYELTIPRIKEML